MPRRDPPSAYTGPSSPPVVGPTAWRPPAWLELLTLVYLLLIGVALVGEGFKWISGGAEGAEALFAFAGNPLVGVIIGVLATALVQSSSTVSAVIVGLVAGGVPVATAVPMIMGANMGTSITNTIVSLGSLGDRKGFRLSFQAATVHDFFNLFSIVLFLPLELMFHPLERAAGVLSGWLVGGGDASISNLNVLGAVTKPVAVAVVSALDGLPRGLGAALVVVLGIGCIVASVILLGRLLRSAMTGRAQALVDRSLGRGPVFGVVVGTLVTVLVQSSSTTTSLLVPLAGAGTLTLRQVYPFTLGANIGTCITALLAATAITGPTQLFAAQIALVHLLYNVFGVVFFLTVPWFRDLPVEAASWLGRKAEENRGWAFGYVSGVFFLLPGVVLGGQALWGGAEGIPTQIDEVEDALETPEPRIEGRGFVIE